MMRNTQKYFLVEPETWQKMKNIGPDVMLKKGYQDFMENKISEENKTKKGWEQYAKNMTPIITQGVQKGTEKPDSFAAKMKEFMGNRKYDPSQADSLYKAISIVPGIDITDDEILVDHDSVGSLYDLFAILLTPNAELTDNVQEVLKKISNEKHVITRIKNKRAKQFILAHNVLHQNRSVFVPPVTNPPALPRARVLSANQKKKQRKKAATERLRTLALERKFGSPLAESTPEKNARQAASAQRRKQPLPGSPALTRLQANERARVKKALEYSPDNDNGDNDDDDDENEITVINSQQGTGKYNKKKLKLNWKSLF